MIREWQTDDGSIHPVHIDLTNRGIHLTPRMAAARRRVSSSAAVRRRCGSASSALLPLLLLLALASLVDRVAALVSKLDREGCCVLH